jgi:Reverse transcriptase (RNA-dependent DNA polymerase)
VTDRVVQAALKLVLEPIFEADFQPCSYGFRPKQQAQDAIAEIHFFGSHCDEWVLEGDITACFDEIDHAALMGRVRRRVGDKRVLALVKAFRKAGIRSEDGARRDTVTGTHKGESSHRCSATSPCRSSTSSSPRRGRQWDLPTHVSGADAGPGQLPADSVRGRLCRHGGWHPRGCREPAGGGRSGPGRDGAYACQRPRQGWSTSTRASTSSGFASSGTASEVRPGATSTPTRPRPPWRPSRRTCGRRLGRGTTNRSPSCWAGSTRCCGDGPTTSATGCPRRPSTICAPSSGDGWSAGLAISTRP